MSNALKTPSFSRSTKKKNPSLLKVFKKGGKDGTAGLPSTAPNTPEEETGVTVVANEIDPSSDHLSPMMLSHQHQREQVPSPLRGGEHRSYSSKSLSAAREEKKEEPSPSSTSTTAVTVTGDRTVEDVVSKTLNFFDDMCAVPQMSAPTSASASASAFCDRKARGAVGSSIKKHPHLLTREYTAFDDTTSSPSMRSETTGQSSVDRSTRCSNYTDSTSAAKKNNRSSNKQGGGIPMSLSHEHENFEVVLDPASMLKEEKVAKPVKQTRAKRWPRLSKSLASSLSSSSSQKKEKQQEQTLNKSNRNRKNSGTDIAATQESKASSSPPLASPSSLSARLRSLELAESPVQKPWYDDEVPLDEEIGHLVESTDPEQRQKQHVPEEELAATADAIPEANTDKQQKSSGIGSVGPKVLAKKIWEKAKKIPIPVRHGEKKNQQHHRAEVDNEAAIASRSSELNKSLEEQDFLQKGCPKQEVEPILEENESDVDNDGDDTGKLNDEQHASSMANTWNNIFSSITNTLDPKLSGGHPRPVGPKATKSLLNTSTDSSNLSSSIEGYGEADVDDSSDSSSVGEDQQKRLLSQEGTSESVEVSHAKKKTTTSKTALLGHRLKKIQKSAYFKNSRKGAKKSKAKSSEQSQQATENESSQASSGTKSIVPAAAAIQFPPKLVWKSVVDPNSGRTYYYHRKTRETTWNKPEELTQYEIEYNKWADTASFNEAIQSVSAAEADNTEETKEEEKASISIRSSSWPKAGLSREAATDEKAHDTPISRTSSHPVQGCGMIPLQMSDTTVSPVEETNISVPKTPTKVDTSLEESNIGATQVEETKITEEQEQKKQQPFDESKPFDESTPFDEPLADTGPGLLFLPRSPKRFGRTTTYTSKASARSALTDRTEKIKNTGKGKFSAINAINENMSTGTSISSYTDNARFGRGVSSHRIPSRVPVVRERQLMVEELTDSRINAESYEGKAGEKRGRIVKGRARQQVETTQDSLYDGDNDTTEDFGASTFDNETYGTDSVSALSENDTDFLSRRDNFDQARRRALDAAIDIEDWDLAAALSDGMRAANLPGGYEKAHSSWNQSSLDKFIANNDWNAVKSYIARMRVESKKEQGQVSTTRRKNHTSSANKRVGSRSQIQHRDMMSESSWSGSDSESSYETYDSESQI